MKNKSNSKLLLTATVDGMSVPDKIWNEIKNKFGIFKEGDENFLIWVEEIGCLSTISREYIEDILDEHQGEHIDLISFQ
jgi:hypothetical protein